MPRRAVTFITAAVLVLGLGLAGALLPVPYVALYPGPTMNVLGKVEGKPLITIDGHEVYPDSGHLNLVTVAYRGGPGRGLTLFRALRGWLDPQVTVLPEEALFPEGRSKKEVRRATSRRMRRSQQQATVAALCTLPDIPVDPEVNVSEVIEGMPAEGELRPGDVLLAVNGNELDTCGEVFDLISTVDPGERVSITVSRDGQRKRLRVRTTESPTRPGRAMIGVLLSIDYDYPLQVKIRIDEIGGPSAGMIFALGIVDKLTEGDLTGGRFIAGTGTIDPDGDVGPIGGIAQKMAGASQDGAEIFLVPKQNCAAAREAKPTDLRLIRVDTLADALHALRALKTGSGNVPGC